jgi:hypothetical protein
MFRFLVITNPSSSEIIKSKSIGEGLSPFRNSFHSICKGLKLFSFLDTVNRIDGKNNVYRFIAELLLTHLDFQNLTLNLISALQTLSASRLLRFSSGNKNLFNDLSRLYLTIISDGFDIEPVIPLLNAVLDNESDDII